MENELFKRQKLNISFENLCYKVPIAKGNEKVILKNINGYFKSGNISAILGPSGGGKSTLLNILTGYTTIGISGTININGETRNLDQFNKTSRYIMDESSVASYLTVHESMFIASRFKLGNRMSKEDVTKTIEEYLSTLRLSDCKDTLTDHLSSGEKKRLVIALELLGSPSIIFLDEPTTGLDEQNSYECISLLRKLAEQGITVILSIHTPSRKVLEQFHQLYIVAEGQCVFQGNNSELLPIFNQIMLECPLHYNPIDFLIEISSGEYGNYIEKLVELTGNGTSNYKSETLENHTKITNDDNEICPFRIQFLTLMHRAYLQGKNNMVNLFIRLVVLIFLVLIVSRTYYKCGNDGTKIMTNITWLILSVYQNLYLIMVPVLFYVPTEMKLVRSEYFNKWYDVLPYFLAVSMQTLLFILVSNGLYLATVYPLTDQPLEINRMSKFLLINVLVSIVTEAICQIVGSILKPVSSLFTGVCVIMPWAVFAFQGFGHEFDLLPLFYQYMSKISYIRVAVEGLAHSVYNHRNRIYCPEDEVFCIILTPDQIMKQFGFDHSSYTICVLSLILWFIVTKTFAFFVLKERLKPTVVTKKIYMLANFIKIHFCS